MSKKKGKNKPLNLNMSEDDALRLMLNTPVPSHFRRESNHISPKRKKAAKKSGNHPEPRFALRLSNCSIALRASASQSRIVGQCPQATMSRDPSRVTM
jgi:hypothetical protein